MRGPAHPQHLLTTLWRVHLAHRFLEHDPTADPSASALHFAVVGAAASAAGIQNAPWVQSAARSLLQTSLHPERLPKLLKATKQKSDVLLRLGTAFAQLGCTDPQFWNALRSPLLQQHTFWNTKQLKGLADPLEAIDALCVGELKRVLQVRMHALAFVPRKGKQQSAPLFSGKAR